MLTLADCIVIRSSRRTLGAEFKNGKAILRLPKRLPLHLDVEQVFERFRPWLEQKQRAFLSELVQHPPKKVEYGALFPLFDNDFELKQGNKLIFKNGWEIPATTQKDMVEELRLLYRQAAKLVLGKKLADLAASFNLAYKSFKVSNAQGRWGSCSKQGNINLNWRLLLLPEKLADYVIIHELAHLKELNHSARFYAVLDTMLPEWKERYCELKNIKHKLDNWI